MNDPDPSPINLDELRMLPDWLREDAPPPSKQYAAHNYPLGDERGERRGGGRPGGFAGGGNRRDARGGAGGGPDRRRDGGRSGPPPRGGGNHDRGPRGDRPGSSPAPSAPTAPAPVRIEFVPDDRCLSSINKQIRATHLAYPLFGLARMFLQEPERHLVEFTVAPDAPAETMLYRLGDEGPISLDRAVLEKIGFESFKDQYYQEETVQKEPLKGNYTNVARERLSGTLLGPTNYHAYQPALRSLYESRYSRRMSFEEFRRNVEVSTDPALIERWKEEARTTTTVSTKVGEGETPVVLSSSAEAKNHFRQHHLEGLLRTGKSFKVHGSVARRLPEASLMTAIRESHDREMRYPAQFVQLLRQGLQNCGLHIFKHRKRVVYVSLAKPTPFVATGAVSPNVAAILEIVGESPLCNRKTLAERVLAKHGAADEAVMTPVVAASETPTPPVPTTVAPATEGVGYEDGTSSAADHPAASTEPTAPSPTAVPEDPSAKAKATLAADLRFLVQSGHIVEFHNGTFDLPLPPRPKEPAPAPAKKVVGNYATVAPAASKAATPAQPLSGATEIPAVMNAEPSSAPEPVADAVPPVADAVSSPAADAVPSLLDEREPAPTPATLSDVAVESARQDLSVEDVEILPGNAESSDGDGGIHDKADDSGKISGADAAPLEAPLAGDTEERPLVQP